MIQNTFEELSNSMFLTYKDLTDGQIAEIRKIVRNRMAASMRGHIECLEAAIIDMAGFARSEKLRAEPKSMEFHEMLAQYEMKARNRK